MSLRPEDLLTHSDDNSFRTKLTGMSLNTKSGVSRGVKIRRSQYELTFNVGRRLLRRLPTDVKNLLKQLAISKLPVKVLSSSEISCTATLLFLGMSFLMEDHSLEASWA